MSHVSTTSHSDGSQTLSLYGAGWGPECTSKLKELFGASDGHVPDFSRLPVCSLWHIEINTATHNTQMRVCEGMERMLVDYPCVKDPEDDKIFITVCSNNATHRPPHGYMSASLTPTGRVENIQQWLAGPSCFVEEGVLAGDYLMGLVHDPEANIRRLHVFHTDKLDDGPLCVIRLDNFLPWGVHSNFVPDVHMSEPQTMEKAR
jgi:hypothetical protein